MARSVVRPSGGATPRLGRRQAIALAGGGMAALGFVNTRQRPQHPQISS